MRLVNIDDCNRALFYKQLGGKNSLITVESAFNMFEALPTAYSVDNVIEELETNKQNALEVEESIKEYNVWNKAIEIVKQGGVSESEKKLKEMERD